MKKILFILSFLFILIIGVSLRFYQLGSIPNSLDWDETALGYNAYAILLTNKDEYGTFLPTTFRSFGDYKAPLYVYLTVPSIKFFGLTPFGVRFPSAFFGSLTIVSVFGFIFELCKKEKYARYIALFTMLFFAISPWSIQFSRGAFEANVALFFVITGSWLLIRGVENDEKFFILASILSFLLSIYTYQTEKIFIPLLLAGYLLWKKDYALKKKLFTIICIILFILGNSIWILNSNATARGASLTFISDQTTLLQHSVREIQVDQTKGDKIGVLLHNRRLVYFNTFLGNYLSHFDPNWLFITGDLARHHAPGMGDLYILSLPLLIIGFYQFFNKFIKRIWIILYWFFIAPIASAFVIGAPHALRTLVFLPTWQFFEACGWISLFSLAKMKRIFLFSLVIVLLFINFVYYCNLYFIHTNTDDGPDWQYGYKQAVQQAYQLHKNGKAVVLDSSVQQAYIFYLFYNGINPRWYQAQGGSLVTLHTCFSIQNVRFGKCSLPRNAIRISAKQSKNPEEKLQYIIPYTTGQPALYVYSRE